jgi:hypothetical protein
VTALAHATLQRLAVFAQKGKGKPPVVRLDGPAVAVQLNPQSMKITRKNNVDRGGITTGVQKRQHPSPEPSVLTFDLEFDTAEQGTTDQRVDVRDWTAVLRQFVEPPTDKPADPPPSVRFAWGTLVFDGIIQEVTEDLGHFAPDGTPLRAKVGVTITEQNYAYEKMQKGPATATADGATEPGAGAPEDAAGADPLAPPPGTEPGSRGSARPDRVAAAQGGESAQQLLARLGLDPSTWRAAMNGLDSPLALPAGLPVEFGAEVESAATMGTSTGFATGATADSAAALRGALSLSAPDGRAVSEAGKRLASAGGVAAAAGQVAAAGVRQQQSAARASFDVPTGGRTDVTDPRALTYGRGVPLRARAPRPAATDRRRPGDGGSMRLPERRGGCCG